MFWSFVLAATLIELTPGPNMTWLAVLGASKGRTAALAAVAGICLGLAIAATVAGTGLGLLFNQFPQLANILRWAGTLYLFYLAWDAWHDADEALMQSDSSVSQSFTQGMITNVLNPKAYLFYLAMLPQFVDATQSQARQIIMLSAIYVAIATAIHAIIALLAGSAAEWLQRSSSARFLRKILALLIAATAAWFFYSTRII
jgi:threonine/homoserine/homoserine lactone efflux protein